MNGPDDGRRCNHHRAGKQWLCEFVSAKAIGEAKVLEALGGLQMHWWSNACLIGVALMAVTTAFGQVKEIAFYVAPNGDDAWSGRLPAPNAPRTDGPFATLHRAIEAIRQLKRQRGGALHQPVTVYLREGTYFLREPIVLTPEDSGTSECPITFAAYRKERPIISGGRLLTNWRREKVNGKVAWVAEVPEAASGKWFFRLLRVGNAWAIRARYPDFDPQKPLDRWLAFHSVVG